MKNYDKRVAFPTNDRENVEEHFGHANEFAFANVKNGKVMKIDFLIPPPHAPGVIPKFVYEQGATAIVTGGMGSMAINLFKERSIDVIVGARGSINETLSRYIEDELVSTGAVCEHHQGGCNER